jgi:hypothetical protein
MKTLIFLITICTCVAMGQKIPTMTDSGNQWIKNHDFTAKHNVKSTPLTLEDWDEYVKECRNKADTVIIPVIGYYQNDGCAGWSYRINDLRDTWYEIGRINPTKEWQNLGIIYLYKEPNFPEFIEWLRRKK